jgi:hypothetical protein
LTSQTALAIKKKWHHRQWHLLSRLNEASQAALKIKKGITVRIAQLKINIDIIGRNHHRQH